MYVATLYPDRISVRYDGDTRSACKKWEDSMLRKYEQSKKNLAERKKTWKLSYQSKKKIYDSVSYLHQMAPQKTIKTKSGKLIYGFKTSFITLTLPSKQTHSDIEIKGVLNNFLTTLRQKFGLQNYVWKAELQQNENIHFHIIVDMYIHHHAIRYYWNKALNVLGYVDCYRSKFENMSLKEYAESRNVPVKKAVNGFVYGRKTKWSSPGTENVQAIKNGKMLSYYIGKYITKATKEGSEVSEAELKRIESFGRVWGRSQSLSRLKFITRYDWNNLKSVLKEIDKKLESFDKVVYDYCTVYYLNGQRKKKVIADWIHKKMKELAITYRYPIPET